MTKNKKQKYELLEGEILRCTINGQVRCYRKARNSEIDKIRDESERWESPACNCKCVKKQLRASGEETGNIKISKDNVWTYFIADKGRKRI